MGGGGISSIFLFSLFIIRSYFLLLQGHINYSYGSLCLSRRSLLTKKLILTTGSVHIHAFVSEISQKHNKNAICMLLKSKNDPDDRLLLLFHFNQGFPTVVTVGLNFRTLKVLIMWL